MSLFSRESSVCLAPVLAHSLVGRAALLSDNHRQVVRSFLRGEYSIIKASVFDRTHEFQADNISLSDLVDMLLLDMVVGFTIVKSKRVDELVEFLRADLVDLNSWMAIEAN